MSKGRDTNGNHVPAFLGGREEEAVLPARPPFQKSRIWASQRPGGIKGDYSRGEASAGGRGGRVLFPGEAARVFKWECGSSICWVMALTW